MAKGQADRTKFVRHVGFNSATPMRLVGANGRGRIYTENGGSSGLMEEWFGAVGRSHLRAGILANSYEGSCQHPSSV